MRESRRVSVFSLRHAAPVIVAALVVLAAGCGKKSTEPENGGSSTFAGTMAGSSGGNGVSGSLSIALATGTGPQPGPMSARRAQVEATGTLMIGSTAITLSGSYDDANGNLTISGGGYTFSGTRSGATLSGIFNDPGGLIGGFTVSQTSASSPARVYCGVYASSTPGGVSGTWNLVVVGSTVTGLAVDSQTGEVLVLNGTLSGANNFSIADPNGASSTPFATGSLDTGADTVAGTWDDGIGDTGNWSGARC